jgi:hypothetical protein
MKENIEIQPNEIQSSAGTYQINKPLKLNTVHEGEPNDNILVYGTDNEVKYVNNQFSNLQDQINYKQETLDAGVNIMTINGSSLLGPGDLIIDSGNVQVNSDWNATSGVEQILNKPAYFKDIVTVSTLESLPSIGDPSTMYVVTAFGNKYYLWANSSYKQITKINGVRPYLSNLVINDNYVTCHGGTFGISNTIFGKDAFKLGSDQDSARHNTVFGWNAFSTATNAYYNTVYGSNALASWDGTGDNTAFGYGTLSGSLNGSNTAFGSSAGIELTTGTGNLILGSNSARGLTTGNGNIFVGMGASPFRTSSSYNVVLGNVNPNQGLMNNTVIIADGQQNKRIVIDSAGKTVLQNKLNILSVPVYADNTAATAGGLVVGDVYRTATGQLMIKY